MMVDSRQIAAGDVQPLAFAVLAKSAVQVAHTGDILEFALATITIPANTLGPNGIARIRADFSCTNSGNTKSLRIRLGGIAGTVIGSIPGTTIASGQIEAIVSNRNNAALQVSNGLNTRGTDQLLSSANGVVTASVDTTADTTIVITGQLTNTGETVSLERYVVK